MANLDLQAFLKRFGDVCQAKFNQAYNFEYVEKKLLPVREGDRELTARDVALMFDSSRTPFAKYWPAPREKELALTLNKERLRLHKISPRPQKLFLQLLNLFHNAGVASIVLRFVHPGRFGIFSTPVLNLLQIQRPKTVDLYLDFCEELRVWQERFGLHTVAETEMSLWTYDQLSKGVADPKEADRIRRQFDGDLWLQRRRLSQTLSPFLQRYGPFEMARIVVDIDPNLAGKIAAEE